MRQPIQAVLQPGDRRHLQDTSHIKGQEDSRHPQTGTLTNIYHTPRCVAIPCRCDNKSISGVRAPSGARLVRPCVLSDELDAASRCARLPVSAGSNLLVRWRSQPCSRTAAVPHGEPGPCGGVPRRCRSRSSVQASTSPRRSGIRHGRMDQGGRASRRRPARVPGCARRAAKRVWQPAAGAIRPGRFHHAARRTLVPTLGIEPRTY